MTFQVVLYLTRMMCNFVSQEMYVLRGVIYDAAGREERDLDRYQRTDSQNC